MKKLALTVRHGEYSVVRLPATADVPQGLLAAPGLVSVTRTGTELSVVCPRAHAPVAERAEHGWRVMTVTGPLAFSLTGIVANLAGAMAAAGVPVFVLSTFDTDHLLVKHVDLERATAALREAGHAVDREVGE